MKTTTIDDARKFLRYWITAESECVDMWAAREHLKKALDTLELADRQMNDMRANCSTWVRRAFDAEDKLSATESGLASERPSGSASIEVKRLEANVAELEGMNAALERQVKDVMAAKDAWGKRFFDEQASLSNAAKDERARILSVLQHDPSIRNAYTKTDHVGWLGTFEAWLRDGAPDSSSLDVPKREGRRLVCCGCGKPLPEAYQRERGASAYAYHTIGGNQYVSFGVNVCDQPGCGAREAVDLPPEGGAR